MNRETPYRMPAMQEVRLIYLDFEGGMREAASDGNHARRERARHPDTGYQLRKVRGQPSFSSSLNYLLRLILTASYELFLKELNRETEENRDDTQ